MKLFKSVLIVLLCTFFLIPKESIVEKVDVDWWVFPLFAVDKEENSITDLKKGDIRLLVNGKEVSEFDLYKRAFDSLSEKTEEIKFDPRIDRGKIAFLIFDVTYQFRSNLKKVYEIADELISNSGKSTHFVLMTFDPLAGLQYLFGPSNEKEKLRVVMDRNIKMIPNARDSSSILGNAGQAQIIGEKTGIQKYESRGKISGKDEMTFQKETKMMLGLNIDRNFFYSFESLYYSLSQIPDNKFVYLFSEGLSELSARNVDHGIGEFYRRIQKSSELLGKSGAVIFIIDPRIYADPNISGPVYINPNSEDPSSSIDKLHSISGSYDSLKSLATVSGGKYLSGTKAVLTKRLLNMNKAYYEIAFSSETQPKGKILSIDIKPRKKGIHIHSLKSLEKRKSYGDMNTLEKEVLVLNLLNRNKYFKSPLSTRGFYLLDHKISKDFTQLKFELPGKYKMKTVDVFLVYSNPEDKTDVSIKKEKKQIRKNKIVLNIKNRKLKHTKIVMINENNSVAFIDDFVDVEDKFARDLRKQNKNFDRHVKKMSTISKQQMSQILKGTGEYCNKLDSAIFHYICREEILETTKELGPTKQRIESAFDHAGRLVNKRVQGKVAGNIITNKKKFIYDYQLLQNRDQVVEQRKRIEVGKNPTDIPNAELKLESFLSNKIAMTPLAIFDILNQAKFKFRFLKNTRINKVDASVIEVFPIDFSNAKSIYGKVWVDRADHSILKIEVNPVSIGGFRNLYIRSGKIGGILQIKCSIEFYLKRDGVRFPTSVEISEKYIGGPVLSKLLRVKFLEKNRIEYKYTDYKFFDVDTEVKVQK